MKALISNLAVLFLMLSSITAQTGHLNSLPQGQRDSILTAVAKDCMLRYAPQWYNGSLVSEIKFCGYSKSGREDHKNRQFFNVTYYVDKSKIPSGWPFLAQVAIWEDTGKATQLTLGPGYTQCDLDTHPDTMKSGIRRESVPYPKQLKRPFDNE